MNAEQAKKLDSILGFVERSDSFSGSGRRMLEDSGKSESDGVVKSFPVKPLQAAVNV